MRLTAAAARQLGIKCVFVLTGKKPRKYEGNLLLTHILAADVRFTKRYHLQETLNATMRELKDKGLIVYLLPGGC